jgi:hypothetical protein
VIHAGGLPRCGRSFRHRRSPSIFFDPWRDADKTQLAAALGLAAPIVELGFEFKPKRYPVRPRSPNLDLLIRLENGQAVGVESKFSEPFRSDDGHGVLSARYFSSGKALWTVANLEGAQALADGLRPQWAHLDTAQLLKHLLGLAHAPESRPCFSTSGSPPADPMPRHIGARSSDSPMR